VPPKENRFVASFVLITTLTFLVVIFLSGCSPTTNQPPSVSFSASPTSGEAPLEVSFDASSSSDNDGNIIIYDWEFGDSTTGSGETVTHTYESAGDYNVELTVTDDEGASDEITETVSVDPVSNTPPTANFTYNSTDEPAPFHVNFSATDSGDPDGTIESYEWEFGDGSTGSGEFITHTYDYAGDFTVKLTVTDDDDATDSATKNIPFSPNLNPNATFTVDPVTGEAPLKVSFDASTSDDRDGSIVSYDWSFGDGSNGSGETTTHTYESAGEYTVELTVKDDDGAKEEATDIIYVITPPPPPPE